MERETTTICTGIQSKFFVQKVPPWKRQSDIGNCCWNQELFSETLQSFLACIGVLKFGAVVLKKGLDVRLLLANDDDERLSVICAVEGFDAPCFVSIFIVLTFSVKFDRSSSETRDDAVSSPSLYVCWISPSVVCLYNGHHVPSSPKQMATSPGSRGRGKRKKERRTQDRIRQEWSD